MDMFSPQRCGSLTPATNRRGAYYLSFRRAPGQGFEFSDYSKPHSDDVSWPYAYVTNTSPSRRVALCRVVSECRTDHLYESTFGANNPWNEFT